VDGLRQRRRGITWGGGLVVKRADAFHAETLAFGLPIMGVFALFAAIQDGGTFLWILAPALIVVDL
jgi:hypothetical protein